MSPTFIDKLHGGCRQILSVKDDLEDLADAFAATGNQYLAIQLSGMARDLQDARDLIHKTTGEIVHDAVVASTEASNNMLRAAIAGIEHGAKTKPA
jgi:hypothetical protein